MLNTAEDKNAYILGILWGTMSVWGKGFWVRHRDRWFVQIARDYLELRSAIQKISDNGKTQYRIKIAHSKEVSAVRDLLEIHGWTPRNAAERPYPSGPLDDRGFIRAWVELHSSLDAQWV